MSKQLRPRAVPRVPQMGTSTPDPTYRYHVIYLILWFDPICLKSRVSSVGIATGYRLDDRMIGVRFPAGGWEVFSSALGPTQPSIQWVPGVLSLGVKRLGREADH
jgi:hypothetical protein